MGDFSYSGDPSLSLLDYVRFEAQDTDVESPLLTDGEILFCLAHEAPNDPPSEKELLLAAAHACEAIGRRLSRQANSQVGSLRLEWDKAAKGSRELAKELRDRAAKKSAPWSGGRSKSEKEAILEDPDKTEPKFTRSQFKSPWAALPQSGPVTPGEGAFPL